jgi:hypothetical protein
MTRTTSLAVCALIVGAENLIGPPGVEVANHAC